MIPKLVDYDPEGHEFRYDERQPRKLPDWSYEEPPATPPRPGFSPARTATGDVSVRVAPDLAETFSGIAEQAGTDLGHEIDAALRAWLARERKTR
jgi:hypothetical protein